MGYYDAHSHLHDKAYDADREAVYKRMREAGVSTITIGTDYAESEKAAVFAADHDGVWATIGIHPSDNHKEEWDEVRFAKLAKMPKVVGIGECGLDYYRLDADRAIGKIVNRDDEIDRQRYLFEHQMEFAATHDLPLMLHGRPTKGTMDAYEDMLHIFGSAKRDHGDRLRGDIHFFVGDTIIAKRFLDLGFSMSFTGVITFAREYDEVIRYLPPDSILLETDSPYVAPTPNRGKRNEPAYMIPIYQKMAEIRDTSLDDLIERTKTNIQRTFQVD